MIKKDIEVDTHISHRPCRDATGRREHVKEVVKKGSQNYKEIGMDNGVGEGSYGG